MIAGVVSCPQPPLLLPGMTGRPVAEVEELRAGCRAAIAGLLADRLDSVVLIGGFAAGEVDQPQEPLSLRIGRLLLAEAGCTLASQADPSQADRSQADPIWPVPVRSVLIRVDASVDECLATGRRLAADAVEAGPGSRTGLLVLADGSARRGPKAPGYLDPRAAPFDQAIEQALTTGDPAGLAALDEKLAAELLAAGRAPWQVLAGAVEAQHFQARTYYLGDPFGVWYPVVRWYPEGPAPN